SPRRAHRQHRSDRRAAPLGAGNHRGRGQPGLARPVRRRIRRPIRGRGAPRVPVSDTGPELRWDELTGEWVVVAAQRQQRPNLPDAGCPFCVGGLEAPDPYEVRAFPNRWPPLVPGSPLKRTPRGWDRLPARGVAEVISYSPDHDASLASLGPDAALRVVELWAERTAALLARPDVAYVLVFENRGREVGATIDHPHGQLYAFSFVPPVPAREPAVAADLGCAVCAQVRREDAARTRV